MHKIQYQPLDSPDSPNQGSKKVIGKPEEDDSKQARHSRGTTPKHAGDNPKTPRGEHKQPIPSENSQLDSAQCNKDTQVSKARQDPTTSTKLGIPVEESKVPSPSAKEEDTTHHNQDTAPLKILIEHSALDDSSRKVKGASPIPANAVHSVGEDKSEGKMNAGPAPGKIGQPIALGAKNDRSESANSTSRTQGKKDDKTEEKDDSKHGSRSVSKMKLGSFFREPDLLPEDAPQTPQNSHKPVSPSSAAAGKVHVFAPERYFYRAYLARKSKRLLFCRFAGTFFWCAAAFVDIFPHFPVLNMYVFTLYEIGTILYIATSCLYAVHLDEALAMFLSVGYLCLSQGMGWSCVPVSFRATLFLLAKLCLMLVAAELASRNFFRQKKWTEKKAEQAADKLSTQAVAFSISMLFLMAHGARIPWEAAKPDFTRCPFTMNSCGFASLYDPIFTAHDDLYCEIYWEAYLLMREHIRVVRDIFLLNVAAYAVCAVPLLHCSSITSPKDCILNFIRLSLLALVIMGLWIPDIDPFEFPRVKLYVDLVELGIFGLSLLWMSLALCTKEEERPVFDHEPSVLGH